MGTIAPVRARRATLRAKVRRSRRRRHRLLLVVSVAGAAAVFLAVALSRSEDPVAGPDPVAGTEPDERQTTAADQDGLWLSHDELMLLPTDGAAFEALLEVADASLPDETELSERDDHNVRTLAAALVGERLDDDSYREKAVRGLRTVVDAAPGDDLLGAARRLSSYVIAADLLGLSELDPAFDRRFRTWLDEMRYFPFDQRSFGSTIIDVDEGRPNNWGTHAGASRVAAAIYLDDLADLERAATVFRGYLGERSAYADFQYGDLDWQADPGRPVGINPPGATIDGHSVDGVLPDDQRRGGHFQWPPPQENYVWEALQGATVQAELLHRQGFDAWEWESQALRRAVQWLHDEADYPAEGDDRWIPWLVNHAYDASFPTEATTHGKAMGFTDWTHSTPRS